MHAAATFAATRTTKKRINPDKAHGSGTGLSAAFRYLPKTTLRKGN
jgi:hypothetical protein